jgi:hypothetical protein
VRAFEALRLTPNLPPDRRSSVCWSTKGGGFFLAAAHVSAILRSAGSGSGAGRWTPRFEAFSEARDWDCAVFRVTRAKTTAPTEDAT